MTNDAKDPDAEKIPAQYRKPMGPWQSAVVGTVVGAAIFLIGYCLMVGKQESFGSAMFILMPFVTGFSIATVTRNGALVVACCIVAGVFSLLFLVMAGWEGYICCLMALPLVGAAMAIGALVGYAVRGRYLDTSDHASRNTTLVLVAAPLLLVGANEVERPLRNVQQVEVFETSIDVAATPETVWKQLVRMPAMDGERPFLLRIGLPVPDHCTLEREAVGARRVCYFDQGLISQEVTEWQEPQRMAVRTTESTLPGRHWLTFKDAGYELNETSSGTKVTRSTSIGSRLYPRWYWRPFEAWGVESEHGFVLSSLKRAAESND